MILRYFLFLTSTCVLLSCGIQQEVTPKNTNTITELRFVDELVIPGDIMFEGAVVGGLSSIDYAHNTWYVICDDRKNPRFYTLSLTYTGAGFAPLDTMQFTTLKDRNDSIFKSGYADPEALRVNSKKQLIWSSEGNIKDGINPFIRYASDDGNYLKDIKIPKKYLVQDNTSKGPHNNGVFEALSTHYNSDDLWVTTELPLKEDGIVPTSDTANSPVRIAFINNGTNSFEKEYAYMLDKVARSGSLEVNGVTELISYAQDQFLVLERSYASGHADGGNDIKIYSVDISNATDVRNVESLATQEFIPAKKTLVLDLTALRHKLTSGIIDNIEGMTFGPRLENGKKSLVLISDNNFNSFGKQITQLLLFQID